MSVNLSGQKVILGYSGGPDATALAYRLSTIGAVVVPAYINYRKVSGGGKTSKDLRAVQSSLRYLEIGELVQIRAPLGVRSKGERNRFFIEVLAAYALRCDANIVALGTIEDGTDPDLMPTTLLPHGALHGVEVITWDSFGIRTKAGEFSQLTPQAREAVFQTTSCQMWWRTECGNCHSCKARHSAFLRAFGHDPTVYRPNSRVMLEHQ